MRLLVTLFLCLCVLHISCGGKESAAAYTEVHIRTPDDRYLIIRADGSGVLGFGSNPGKPLPTGTYDFSTMVPKLQESLQDQRTSADGYTVWLRERPNEPVVAQFTRDEALVSSLFQKADTAPVADFPKSGQGE